MIDYFQNNDRSIKTIYLSIIYTFKKEEVNEFPTMFKSRHKTAFFTKDYLFIKQDSQSIKSNWLSNKIFILIVTRISQREKRPH